MVSLSRMKSYLVSRGLQSVIPMLSSRSPETLVAMIDTLRRHGIERMKKSHDGTPEELERRVDAAEGFFQMAKRTLPRLSSETQRKLAFNAFFNAINLGDEKRDAYFEKHGEYPPFFLLLSPTMTCNLRCYGCYAWKHPKGKELSREKVSSIIREAKEEMGIYFISITGGEPTLWPHLESIAEEHDDVFFQVYTHGMNIDEPMAERFARLGNVYPAISIEGSETFTDARRGEGAYGKILAAMERLKRHGVLFGFSITHTRLNHESVIAGDFIDTLVDHGAAFGWYFQYIPIGRDPDMELVPTAEQRLERREVCHRLRREKPVLVYDFWNDGDACAGCIAWGRKYLHITAQGLVEPCVFVHFAADSIHDKSLGEVIRGEAFREMRRRQPFTRDLRAPCPQIDHPEILKEIVETYGLVPTHEGAENIVGCHHEAVCRTAREWQQALSEHDRAGAENADAPRYAADAAGD